VDRTVRVTGAAPLTTGEEAEVRGRIEETLGEGWAVEFATDPELINGFEAVGPAFTVRNSWRAILERARRDLGEVEHERPV
jgi:F0F1-type ATP synthase delta subunit